MTSPTLPQVIQQIEQALEAGPASVFYIDQRLATACNPQSIRILLDALKEAKAALEAIAAVEDEMYGGDWDEIEHARQVATAALKALQEQPK